MVKIQFSEVPDPDSWGVAFEESEAIALHMKGANAVRTVDLAKADIFQVEGHNLVWHNDVLICVGGDGSDVTLSPDGWDKAKGLKGRG